MHRPGVRIGHGTRRTVSRMFLAVATTCLLFLASGCGLLSGSEAEEGGSGQGGLEKSKITVGTMPAIDVAPLHMAIQRGYFKEAGLEVELQPIQGGAAGIPLLANGELDVTFGNWVSFFKAQEEQVVDLKIVSDGYQADDGMFLTMTMPGNGVDKVTDLKDGKKKVAVNTRKNLNELSLIAAMQTRGVQPEDVEFVVMPFPDMPAALQRGDVQAASMIEPFISQANQLGAKTLVDTATGPTADIPIAGYAGTQKFAEENPKTAAAFQRVMHRAQTEASQDRAQVEDVLPSYAKIDEKTAALVRLGVFPTTLEAGRLQRVAELMQANGELSPNFQVEPLLFQAPAEN